jgi:hypothetical protein
MIDQSETFSRSQVQSITLLCTTVLRLLPALAICTFLGPINQFRELNKHNLTILQQILLSRVTY